MKKPSTCNCNFYFVGKCVYYFFQTLKRRTAFTICLLIMLFGMVKQLQAQAGMLDTTFVNSDVFANGSVYDMTVQPDGKIVIGGFFTTVGGQNRNYIVRLSSSGMLDTSFITPNLTGSVQAMTVQPDGKILIGGYFFSVDGVVRTGVARLNSISSFPDFPGKFI